MEKVQAVVARGTFGSQNVPKNNILGALLEVAIRSTLEVKMYKTLQFRSTLGSWDVEKVHAVVGRSTFGSKKCQNTSASDDFWKCRCRKSARRCGAKHILIKNVKITAC